MTNPADRPAPNRNSVRHGLAAEFPQSKDKAHRLRILTATFTARLRPADDVETALVRHAAASVLRLERCEEAERTVEGPNLVAAFRDWEREHRHAVRRRDQSLAEDPVGTVDDLEQSAFGCDWLLRKWAGLRDLALGRRGWTSDATRLALRLLGHRPEAASPPDDPDAAVVLAAAGALHDGDPADSDPAVAALAALADREIARLEPLRDAGWSAVERPERNAVLSNARLDTSPSGRLRHRYTQDAERSIGRSIDLLVKFRKAEQAAAELPPRSFRPAPAAERPAAERPAASGAPAEAPPSRNEPKSTAPETVVPVRIVNDSNGLNADAPLEPIAPSGAPRPSPTAHRRARGRPADARDRPRPPPDVLRAGQARSGPPCPCLSRTRLSSAASIPRRSPTACGRGHGRGPAVGWRPTILKHSAPGGASGRRWTRLHGSGGSAGDEAPRCRGGSPSPAVVLAAAPALGEDEAFERSVRPLLVARCQKCHGPDEGFGRPPARFPRGDPRGRRQRAGGRRGPPRREPDRRGGRAPRRAPDAAEGDARPRRDRGAPGVDRAGPAVARRRRGGNAGTRRRPSASPRRPATGGRSGRSAIRTRPPSRTTTGHGPRSTASSWPGSKTAAWRPPRRPIGGR